MNFDLNIFSAVDGALSCSRAINVDVIDCYERKKYRSFGSTNQRLHQSSAPTRKISTTENLSQENKSFEQRTEENASQRAFAVENEIRNFRKFQNFS